jgi:flagellar basal-body rod modification protein FlgD
MDGTQFASQLAQFSQLEQLQNLNDSMTQSINANVTLTQSINNTLAATLIGKQVKVTGGTIQYTGQSSAELGYTLPGTASSVTLNIYNSQGVLVKTEQNQPTTSGDHQLSWDFTDNNDNKLANDTYTYSIQATGTDGSNMTATLYNLGTINAVKFTSSGTVLSIDGTDYKLSDILEILSANSSGGN